VQISKADTLVTTLQALHSLNWLGRTVVQLIEFTKIHCVCNVYSASKVGL